MEYSQLEAHQILYVGPKYSKYHKYPGKGCGKDMYSKIVLTIDDCTC